MNSDAITADAEPIKPPLKSSIVLYDIEHEVDLEACRIQMPLRIAQLMASGKRGGGRQLIASAADVDYKTLSTFLDGGRVSPESLIAIIERGLRLKFADIVKPSSVGKEA